MTQQFCPGLLKASAPAFLLCLAFAAQPSQAAMCGSSPTTTSPGYYCSNMCHASCPYPMSCNTSCCGWDLNGWGTITCGQSGYGCSWDYCGNGTCGSCEFHGTCARDCSDGGSGEANPSVPWVAQRFDRIDAQGTKLGLWFATTNLARITMLDGSRYFLSDPPAGAHPWYQMELVNDTLVSVSSVRALPSVFAPVQLHTLSACHVQGFQRLRAAPYVAYTFKSDHGGGGFNRCYGYSDGGAHLFLANIASKGSAGNGEWGTNRGGGSRWNTPTSDVHELNLMMDKVSGHPGGFQAVGDYLVTGMDPDGSGGSKIRFWNVINPRNPQYLATPSFDVSAHRAEGVAMVRLADERYLLAVSSEQAKRIDFYLSRDEHLPSTEFDPAGTWRLGEEGLASGSVFFNAWCDDDPFLCRTEEGWVNYSSYNLLRESGTNKIFLVGLGRTEADFCGADPLDGRDFIHLFELSNWEDASPGVSLKGVDEKHMIAPDCNFCAGAGMYVQHNSKYGTLAVYCSEHQGDYESGTYEGTGIRTENDVVWSQVVAYEVIPGPIWGVIRFNEFFP